MTSRIIKKVVQFFSSKIISFVAQFKPVEIRAQLKKKPQVFEKLVGVGSKFQPKNKSSRLSKVEICGEEKSFIFETPRRRKRRRMKEKNVLELLFESREVYAQILIQV